jgi:hypothetical protein
VGLPDRPREETVDQDLLRYEMNIKGGYRFTRGRLNGRVHKVGVGAMPIADITRLDISTCLSEVRRRSASQAYASIILLNTVMNFDDGLHDRRLHQRKGRSHRADVRSNPCQQHRPIRHRSSCPLIFVTAAPRYAA